VVQRVPITVAGVVYRTSRVRRAGGLDAQTGHILDVCEIARLFAIAENRGRPAIDQGRHEQR